MARQTLIVNPWQNLRAMTPARIALGRCGVSQPTAVQLEFQLAHAQARDAVHLALDVDQLRREIEALGLPTLALRSAASTREIYLQRPDLGRRLDEASRLQLAAPQAKAGAQRGTRITFVVADGLSALAVQRHAAALLGEIKTRLLETSEQQTVKWQIAPVAVVEQGRVAIGDEIGEHLGSQIVVVLIGERPGLSSPDSLGIYLTWAPRIGRSDAERNCISNVRPQGLPCEAAAQRLSFLIEQAAKRQLSGVELKDDSDSPVKRVSAASATAVFLLGDQS